MIKADKYVGVLSQKNMYGGLIKSLISLQKFKSTATTLFLLGTLTLFQNCTPKADTPAEAAATPPACTTLLCTTSKYSILVADLDGANVSVIKTSSYQDMTHVRVSNDKNWVAYTMYNDTDSNGCASHNTGYFNTEIRAVQINGSGDKRIIAPVAGQLNSNNYWIGTTNEFSYLSGPVSALKFYRVMADSAMTITSGPTQIPVSSLIIPVDPQTNLATNKIVYPGLYENPFGSGNFVKSIFIMNLSDSANVIALSLGRDRAGTPLICVDAACANIMENDPKISPDGANVAFMRQAPSSGANGFGWHIFVVPVVSVGPAPLNEVDISYASLGSDILKNEGLPEWIDNTTLIFSSIEITSATEVAKNVYTMKSDGTLRTKISLPDGFRYADVFPFTDASGKQRMILSAEKIGATCTQ